jgi:hypothetical protein
MSAEVVVIRVRVRVRVEWHFRSPGCVQGRSGPVPVPVHGENANANYARIDFWDVSPQDTQDCSLTGGVYLSVRVRLSCTRIREVRLCSSDFEGSRRHLAAESSPSRCSLGCKREHA